MNIEELKHQLKLEIIEALNLIDYTPEDIADDEAFFGDEGLELDSIDSLELSVLLERNYGLKITDPKEGKKILVDIQTMAEYVMQNSKNQ